MLHGLDYNYFGRIAFASHQFKPKLYLYEANILSYLKIFKKLCQKNSNLQKIQLWTMVL